ncbi:carbohydrate ABC transporter permease [Caldilinea sp.]|jgi:multiple sugar transport system permease protein|uniref:carbohydrate ABC transporter permease n=1 Tax=Caldilinea sp. TaxID=2293560 RepID=UPI0021DEB0C8|nr:sugar ABC transporter permease [Caldilinea sp.]GIV70298.1 MAG: sugar ABC transporter permease [Caldilinea sp.]
MSKIFRKSTPLIYLSPTILLLTILSLIPIVMVFIYSFMDNVVMNQNPKFVGMTNYVKIVTNSVFLQAFSNTMYFTVMSVVFHLILGLTFALLLNARALPPFLKAIFRTIYILPWVFTAAVIAILWRLMLNPNGVINYLLITFEIIERPVEWLSSRQLALHAVTFINIWAGYPFYMVSLLAGLQGISEELYEAGTIDGANQRQLFWYITLPQLKPIIISLAMLDFIWTMHQFTLIWMTTGGGPIRATEMLSTLTYKLAFSSYQFSHASATAFLILALSAFVAIFYVRQQKAADE